MKLGMVWIWPGDAPPTVTLPSLLPPSGFEIHAEIVMELLVEHGFLLDNLLDLAHAPLTHTSTYAKGWSIPRCIHLLIIQLLHQESLMYVTPIYILDTGIHIPLTWSSGLPAWSSLQLESQSLENWRDKVLGSARNTCTNFMYVCLPLDRKQSYLYRISQDFAPVLKHIPFMRKSSGDTSQRSTSG